MLLYTIFMFSPLLLSFPLFSCILLSFFDAFCVDFELWSCSGGCPQLTFATND